MGLRPTDSEDTIEEICSRMETYYLANREHIQMDQEEMDALLDVMTRTHEIHHEQRPRIIHFICCVVAHGIYCLQSPFQNTDLSFVVRSLFDYVIVHGLFYHSMGTLHAILEHIKVHPDTLLCQMMSPLSDIVTTIDLDEFCYLQRVIALLLYHDQSSEILHFVMSFYDYEKNIALWKCAVSPQSSSGSVLRTFYAKQHILEEDSNLLFLVFVTKEFLAVPRPFRREMQDRFLQMGLLPLIDGILKICFSSAYNSNIYVSYCSHLLFLLMDREEREFAWTWFTSEPNHPLRTLVHHYDTKMDMECRADILKCIERLSSTTSIEAVFPGFQKRIFEPFSSHG